MPDYQFTSFPIPGKQVDFEAIQGAITALQERASALQEQLDALKTRTINGLDLTEDRILKSAQFSESVTGEKMFANLTYTDGSASNSVIPSKAIDASGVVVNNSGRTLQDALNTHLLGQATINNLASQSTGSINLSGVDNYKYIMVVCFVESRRMDSVILPTALVNSSHFHVTVMYNQSIGIWSDCFMNSAKTNISITVRGVTSVFEGSTANYYVYGIL